MKITVTFDAGMFGEAPGLDLLVSGQHYAQELTAAISARYPNASVEVTYYAFTSGGVSTITVYSGDDDLDWEAEDAVQRLTDEVYQNESWQIAE